MGVVVKNDLFCNYSYYNDFINILKFKKFDSHENVNKQIIAMMTQFERYDTVFYIYIYVYIVL